jgi:uroporphyrin-III C-methyltransferase/precorrin-2 dehydrogenase/sirohydrochlorin ferrochelatase
MDLDWHALARPRQTLVVYMGLLGLPTLCRELIAHGLSGATPAAIVQHGATARQRLVSGTLSTLPPLAAAATLEPPTLIIIGEVAKLHSTLAVRARARGGRRCGRLSQAGSGARRVASRQHAS